MPLTYSDIETRCANRLRIPTTIAAEMTKLGALINDVYRDIGMKYLNWWWRRKKQILVTSNDITTGTVSVTNNSTTITFSSAPTPSVAKRALLIPGNTLDSGAVYQISTHVAGATGAVLDAVYTGATDAAAAYHVYQDQYSLSTDVAHLLRIKRFGVTTPLDIISPDDMMILKQTDTSEGKPRAAALSDFATTGDPTTARQLIIYPYPDEIYRLEIEYSRTLNTELSGTVEPLIPDDYRQVLVYGTLARGYPIFLNDTTRGTFFQNLFNDVLALMVAVQRDHEGYPQMVPSDSYRRFYTRRRRLSGASVDLGSWFDRLPNEP